MAESGLKICPGERKNWKTTLIHRVFGLLQPGGEDVLQKKFSRRWARRGDVPSIQCHGQDEQIRGSM